MVTPLLSTKLNIPPSRSDLVPRSRLIESLGEGEPRKLTLISAPAGFGKTTLLSTWIKESDFPCAWLSLDPDDNDINRFLLYFITALQGLAADIGHTSLAVLKMTPTTPVETVLTVLINELSTILDDFYLFLDDYHLVDAAEIHSALAYLVEHLPLKMHLVLASRSDPPLPLSRLRARGQLLELRQADLRFTAEEAAAFLNKSIGLDLTVEQVQALEGRTEGWIAGLQLAAISMRGREDLASFIDAFSGSHRFVIDYLADEIFSQLPGDLRQFLRQTSILDRFTPSLCQAITGRVDSTEILRQLEDNNLFLIPLDDQREWYRYHYLFRDFLHTRLDEEGKANLHKKASGWFMAEGLSSEAVKNALASGSTDLAAEVISQAASDAFNQGVFPTLLGWLEALPDQIVRSNHVLATYKGFALFLTSSYEDALPYGLAAEKSLPPDTASSIQGQFLSLKAHLALCEDQLDQCVRYSEAALEQLDEDDQFIRNLTLNVLGQVLEMKGDVLPAVDVYRQAFETGWKAGDRIGAMVVFTNLIFSLNELGRRQEAEELCRQVAGVGGAPSAPGMVVEDALYLPWSQLAYEADELETAGEYARRALELMTAVNFPQGISWGNYILARIHLARGEYDLAQDLVRGGRRLASQIGRHYTHGIWFAALGAQINLDRGNRATAERWIKKMGFKAQDSPHHWLDQPYFTYARVLLAQGNIGEAQTLLNNMEVRAGEERRQRKLITIFLLGALCSEAQGEVDEAIQKVERALDLAAQEDYRRAFLDEGSKIAQLLPKARQAAPAFVDELLYAYRSPAPITGQVDGLVEPLTEREREVLRLVAKGLSNREIAEALFVTLGTVKKHLNNIFSKLNVKSRTKAVTRGRELGLLK